MTDKADKIQEDALQDLAMDAQDSVGTVVQLVDTVHRHKLAAKTNQVALATEVYNLKQKHKNLKKGSQALVKAQKKGKAGPLGGIAREITATLFPARHANESQAESEKASAPPIEKEEDRDEPPPSYDEPNDEAEANVTRAEVDTARDEWRQRVSRAQTKDEMTARAEEQAQRLAKGGFSPHIEQTVVNARIKAREAWEKVEEARNTYEHLLMEFRQEEEQARRDAGLCGPSKASVPDKDTSSDDGSKHSVEITEGCHNGKRQVIIRQRQEPDQGRTSAGSIYPTLPRRGEQEESSQCKEGQEIRIDEGSMVTECETPIHAPHPLQIREIRRVVIPLIPGNEIAWAVLTEQAVRRVKAGEETMLLQALMPQLSTHPEVAAQATMLLVQAANNPEKGKEVLAGLFQWIQSRYKFTPRQKRANFAQKLKEMQWSWQMNPADVLTGIMTASQLTWDEVLRTPALKEELEVAMASKMDLSLHLQITKRDPKEWRKAITEIWEKVKDRLGGHQVEIYLHEGETDSDSEDDEMACNAEMPSAAVAQAHLPKVKTDKVDLRKFDKKLDMVVSALQAQEISKEGKVSQERGNREIQQGGSPQNPSSFTNAQNAPDPRGPLRCYWCHQEGHMKRNCPQRNNRGPGNSYPSRGGWNAGRGNWNGGRGGYNQNRNYYNQNRGYNNGYNRGWNNNSQGQGQGGYQNQNPQYRGYRRGNNRGEPNQMQREDRPTWESEAEKIRQEIIREGRPKASWAEPPPPPSVDEQPALAADHAEANFVQGLNASERWKSETTRPPLMYEQAMAQLADSAPLLQPMEMPGVDFLGQR